MAVAVGSRFPDFTLCDESGTEWNSSRILEKSGLVLFLYPKANTPGCTKQAKAFNEVCQRLHDAGYAVYGLSKDKATAQASWKEKLQLEFPLLSDDGAVISKLGCSSGASTIRSVFVVEKGGVVAVVKRKISPAESVEVSLQAAGISEGEKSAAEAMTKVHEADTEASTATDNSTSGKRTRGVKRTASSAPKAKSKAKPSAKRAPSQKAARSNTASPDKDKDTPVKATSPKKARSAKTRSVTPSAAAPSGAAPKRASRNAEKKTTPPQAVPRAASRKTRSNAASNEEQPSRPGRRAAQ